MPSKNAIKNAQGICPVNRLKYPIERLDERLLHKYEEWVKVGKPASTDEDTSEIDNPTLQLLEHPEQPPPEEIEFVIQEPSTSNHDEITSIPASCFLEVVKLIEKRPNNPGRS